MQGMQGMPFTNSTNAMHNASRPKCSMHGACGGQDSQTFIANQHTKYEQRDFSHLTTLFNKIWDIELGLLGPLNNQKLDYILLTQS